MKSTVYGYARISTKDQNEERQIIALRQFGVQKEHIYFDQASGKDFNRPQYRRLLRRLKRDDVLVVTSIDRLGRSYKDIVEQWRVITTQKQAAIVVLDMPLLDTRNERDLLGTFIADLVLQLLSYVAQTEREFIRSRQAEGIAAAKARGVRFGPKPKEKPAGFELQKAQWEKGEISAREAARRLGVAHKTFLKWAGKTGTKEIPFI